LDGSSYGGEGGVIEKACFDQTQKCKHAKKQKKEWRPGLRIFSHNIEMNGFNWFGFDHSSSF
jgi:hypothetical protein